MDEAPSSDPWERFIAQFEWDGAEAIYRGNRTGAAYRVTVDEYHRFVGEYDRHSKLVFWLLLGGWLLGPGIILLVQPSFALFRYPPTYLMPATAWVLVPTSRWIANYWLLLAPARALRSRPSEAAALSGDERLSRTIGERSWGSLFRDMALFGLLLFLLILVLSLFGGDWVGWLLVAGGVGSIIMSLVQMARKLRLERRQSVAAQTTDVPS